MYPEYFVNLGGGQNAVGGRHSAQNLGVQLDLLERNAVVEAQVDVITQRDHLHEMRAARKSSPFTLVAPVADAHDP